MADCAVHGESTVRKIKVLQIESHDLRENVIPSCFGIGVGHDIVDCESVIAPQIRSSTLCTAKALPGTR